MKELMLIGGGAKGQTWPRILSDIFQMPLKIPAYREEATSMGAAVCAGVGVGIYRDFSEAKRINTIVDTVMPREENRLRYDRLYEIFNHAYDALTGVYGELGAYRNDMGEKHE